LVAETRKIDGGPQSEVCLFQLSHVIADSAKSVSERQYIFIYASEMFTGLPDLSFYKVYNRKSITH